jgi:hypothetical protein
VALMISELYDALKLANVPEEAARKAAEAVATYDARLSGIETKLAVLMLMVGGLYALILPAGWLLVRLAFKLGALA